MADLVSRAFVRALQTYQQQHGQELTYKLEELLGPDVDTEQAVHTQQQQGTTEHELQQPESHAMEDKNAAHTHRQQNAAQTSPSVPQLNGQPACQPCSSKDKTRRRYTSEQLLQLQQNLPQFSLGEDTSSSKQAHQADQQPGPSQITRDQQQGQQDSQWQWDPAHFWTADTGNAYGYQQGSAVPGTMGNAGTAGCQYGSAAAAPQATYMMPPPPPPPSASWWPTASSQPHTTNGWQAAACHMCGKTIPVQVQGYGAAPAVTEPARDPEGIKQCLLTQIPSDVAACPGSLSAAQAAIEKAVAVSQAPHCVNQMPDLMMAWFYAGFCAGKLSSAQDRGDSSGT